MCDELFLDTTFLDKLPTYFILFSLTLSFYLSLSLSLSLPVLHHFNSERTAKETKEEDEISADLFQPFIQSFVMAPLGSCSG